MLRYEIEWLDSGLMIQDGWKHLDEITGQKLSTVRTCGYKIHEDDEQLFIALSSDEENKHYYGVQVIDKKSVKKMTRLRER